MSMLQEEDAQLYKNAAKASWGATPAGWTFGNSYQPGTQKFFESVLHKRGKYECPWLDDIVNFNHYKSKKVLEIGCGAGYDAYQFCTSGADYTGIDITPENIILCKQHLSYYDYHPEIFEMDAEKISLPYQTYDYVYSFGVLHHTPDIKSALRNIYDVLKPHGTVQIILYHKHSLFYWISIVLVDWILKGKFFKLSLQERLSQIEYTTSDTKPLVMVYSKKELKKLMKEAGFTITKIVIRKLVKEDFPDIPVIRRLYPYIPSSWLARVGKKFGWYISVHAIR